MISAAQRRRRRRPQGRARRGHARRPVALPRRRGVRRHRPHDRGRADPRADLSTSSTRNCPMPPRSRPRTWEDRPDGSTAIHQQILVERDSQKAIVIGKGGSRLKIGAGGARGDRRAPRPQGAPVPARQGQPAVGRGPRRSTTKSGWSGPTEAEHLVHPLRAPARPPCPIAAFVEKDAALARLEVDLERPRAAITRGLDEAGGGIDRARRPDRHEQVALPQRVVDPLHVVRHLAEPDDVGAHLAGRARTTGRPRPRPSACPRKALVARQAPAAGQLAVHVEQPLRARALVQIVDILGDQQQLARPFGVEPRQRLDARRWARPCRASPAARRRRRGPAPDRARRPRACRRPRPGGPPTGRRARGRSRARFRRNSGAGQDDDVANVHARSIERRWR